MLAASSFEKDKSLHFFETESLIDLVFTNVPFNITKDNVFALGLSDHYLIGLNRKQNRVNKPFQKLFAIAVIDVMTITR